MRIRKSYRITDHVFILKTLQNKYIEKYNNKLYVSFVDFRKAFDSVCRSALLSKLQMKGIGGKFYNIINKKKIFILKPNIHANFRIHTVHHFLQHKV